MASSARLQKVSDEIQKILVNILQRNIKNPKLAWITITAVEVSKDLSHSKIYFTSMSKEYTVQQVEHALAKSNGYFRTILSKELSIRSAPNLKFIPDTSVDYGNKMEELIKKARNKDRNQIQDQSEDNTQNIDIKKRLR